ncbi:MAG TPA: hypothetical protein VGW36_07840 [Pyrinomonadaceae bacterium]|nr:hypothetical protein [Pyrinomonadaceae bacterium]
MKTIARTSLFLLFLIVAGSGEPMSASAQTSGPSASGTYRLVLEDEMSKSVEFNARLDERGTATGQMTFRDDAKVTEQDVDGVGGHEEEQPSQFFITASFDSMTIDRNRALMGGTITDSSHRSYIGRWIQLVVEDNGDGQQEPDKLSWSICKKEETGWVPADAEVRDDEGAWWKWWATDAEVKDDAGIQSANIIPGNKNGCQAFPLAAYAFAETRSGEGQIQVQP